jgi:TRAP-type uncharacterized transport system fused permease subunit
MVAAGLAGSDMWKTGMVGVQLAAAAYLLPFLWVYNPALVMQGSWLAVVYVTLTATAAGLLIAEAVITFGRGGAVNRLLGVLYFAATIVVGSATLWIGPDSPLTLVAVAVGVGIVVLARRSVRSVGQVRPAE